MIGANCGLHGLISIRGVFKSIHNQLSEHKTPLLKLKFPIELFEFPIVCAYILFPYPEKAIVNAIRCNKFSRHSL